MIQVTKPFLPPKEEYMDYISAIWDRNWLTNSGPLSKELELKLASFLKVSNFTLVSNGTVSLQIAFQALKLQGEVITTPFSYIATTSALLWQDLVPIYADIDPKTFNIDVSAIEKLITSKTTAILATHVFGNPCDLGALAEIAERNNLKLIYDAAHAFGVEVENSSIFQYGDISSLSMHATKLFHSIEGGGIICQSEELAYSMSRMRNFGHEGFEDYAGPGINGKCSEFHAAMGLLNLKYIDEILNQRKLLYNEYFFLLKTITSLSFQEINTASVKYNYSYFPIVFNNETTLLHVMKLLNAKEIFPRRYFHPSLNTIPYVKSNQKCAVSEDISRRIVCLPLSHDMTLSDVALISSIIKMGLDQ